jgi:hypothetical protein
MNRFVQQLLDAFDKLPEAERRQAAAEIFRRSSPTGEGNLPEAALSQAAEALFQALEAEEASKASR